MLTVSDAKENSAAGLMPTPDPRTPWRVSHVEALPEFRFRVRFIDGTEGIVDISARVRSPQAGVFAVLADPLLFNKIFIECGVVTWPGELDLAPDAMYDEIKANGEWVLR